MTDDTTEFDPYPDRELMADQERRTMPDDSPDRPPDIETVRQQFVDGEIDEATFEQRAETALEAYPPAGHRESPFRLLKAEPPFAKVWKAVLWFMGAFGVGLLLWVIVEWVVIGAVPI